MEMALNVDPDFAVLQRMIEGTVIGPMDAQYEEARRAWNLSVEQRPAVIVFAENSDDVIEAVRFARGAGLRVAVTATGHGVIRPADGALLLNLSRLNSIDVDVQAKMARLGGGVKWGPVLAATQAHGLAPLLGSSPDVGAVGYTLGGGMGWLARKYGLSADSVLWFEVVTSEGRKARASAEENSDLFWALRGGGGSLAIVTEMAVRLYAVTEVYGGNLFYPLGQAREVMARYREWVRDAPEELTSSIVLMNFPPIPDIPEFLRGQSFVIVRGCYAGPVTEGEQLVQQWREWQAPLIDDFKAMPFADVATISNDPVDPLPGFSSGMWLRELSDDVIESLIGYGAPSGGPPPLVVTEVRHAGGAIARGNGSDAAYGNRVAPHNLQVIAITPSPEVRQMVEGHWQAMRAALTPYGTGGSYLNFLEGSEAQERVGEGFSSEVYGRLRALKARWDPDNVLAYSTHIAPESAD